MTNTGSSDSELADEEPVREPKRKSHFEVVTEQPTSASNRKLSASRIAPGSSTSYRRSLSAAFSRLKDLGRQADLQLWGPMFRGCLSKRPFSWS